MLARWVRALSMLIRHCRVRKVLCLLPLPTLLSLLRTIMPSSSGLSQRVRRRASTTMLYIIAKSRLLQKTILTSSTRFRLTPSLSSLVTLCLTSFRTWRLLPSTTLLSLLTTVGARPRQYRLLRRQRPTKVLRLSSTRLHSL